MYLRRLASSPENPSVVTSLHTSMLGQFITSTAVHLDGEIMKNMIYIMFSGLSVWAGIGFRSSGPGNHICIK
jgi:hypothetical protein